MWSIRWRFPVSDVARCGVVQAVLDANGAYRHVWVPIERHLIQALSKTKDGNGQNPRG